DRERRYESASALAADVQRYLDDEPVQACPPSAAYCLTKFARRNKAALTTAGLVVAALLIGTAVSVWQAIEANQARNLAMERMILANQRLDNEKQAREEADEQRQRAEVNYGKARKAVQQMLTRVAGMQLRSVPPGDLRRRLLKDAVAFYTDLL